MKREANPEMLILAREVRGITQKELAEICRIDQGRISRYEGGLKPVPETDLDAISVALSFPVSFFYQTSRRFGVETSEIFHRKRQSLSVAHQKRIDGLVNVFRLGIERLLNDVELKTHFTIPRYRPNDPYDPEQIASMVRSAWRMPTGPVQNLIEQLEAAGCIVFPLDFGTDLIDEAVQWIDPTPPIIAVNTRAPGDRARFSLAHALGHLVMHHDEVPYPDMEGEADRFASAFLMPVDSIRAELQPVTIDHLLQLKPYWKVSVQALIRRARDIGEISDRRYTSLFQMLSRAGYRKIEPQPIEREKPQQVIKLITLFRNELNYSDEELASLVSLSLRDFREWYSGEATHLRLVPKGQRAWVTPASSSFDK